MKLAEVIPIYKSGSKTDINNYRPISLLSPFSKIFETHIHNNLTKFFNRNKVIYNNQFGFKEDSSTELAVIDIINEIISSVDNNLTNCCIFLDLAKAFNTVNHGILLSKLDKYGVRGPPLHLIKHYLNNRQQITNINNFKSNKLNINVGVPQGSCLGPLLFLIYINDMHLCTSLKLSLFADDTCLSLSHEDPQILQNCLNMELKNINNWLEKNKLFLNHSKSNYLIFSKKKNKPSITISINNNILQQQHTTNYLGIIIDDNLNWKPHINNLKLNLSRSCYALSKLRNYANLYTMKNIYYSLFYSKLKYCISSWGGASESVLNPLIKLQKRAIRYISFKPARTPTNSLFIEMKMLKVNEIHKFEISKLVHKMGNNNLQGNLKLVNLNTVHNYQTRSKSNNNFYINSCRTDLGKTCFNSIAPRIWREVPTNLKSLNSGNFKNKLKSHLLALYQNNS